VGEYRDQNQGYDGCEEQHAHLPGNWVSFALSPKGNTAAVLARSIGRRREEKAAAGEWRSEAGG
jgi:hypothetical protein